MNLFQQGDAGPSWLNAVIPISRNGESNVPPIQMPFVVVAIAMLAAASAQGGILYSVDIGTDELVSIDSSDGSVSVIGGLGVNLHNTSLARSGGTLFALETLSASQFSGGAPVRSTLYTINTATGTATSVATLSVGGDPDVFAEGFTVQNGELIVSYSVNPAFTVSNNLGLVSLSGVVSPLGNTGLDLDNLAADSLGDLFGHDITATNNDLYALQPSAFRGSSARSEIGAASGYSFFGSDLFAITRDTNLLAQIDPSDANVIGTVALSRSGDYSGLASAVPEPSSLALLAMGVAALAGGKWRRKRRMKPAG